jgi:hypothetical protein
MANKAPVKVEEKNLTTIDEELERMISEDVGKGVSTSQADNLVPLVYILQPLSPQVMSGSARIDGAKPGDIWLKNSDEPIVSGDEGIWFQPCVMYQKWTEWVPREKGGGFLGSFDYLGRDHLPPGAERDLTSSRPRFWFPSNGHELVDTRYEAGLVWQNGTALPYVIPFKSTGHAVSRGWMTKRVNQRRKDGTIWPAWSFLYNLTTALRKNNLGSWYVFEIGVPVPYLPGYGREAENGMKIIGNDPKKAYILGHTLEKAFQSGSKTHMQEDADVGAPDTGAADYDERVKEKISDDIPY